MVKYFSIIKSISDKVNKIKSKITSNQMIRAFLTYLVTIKIFLDQNINDNDIF